MERNEVKVYEESHAISKSNAAIFNFEEARNYARYLLTTNFVPKYLKGKPGAEDELVMKMYYGHEVGLNRIEAVKNVAVINNIPSIWGDAMLALVLRSGLLQDIRETIKVTSDEDMEAECYVMRKGILSPTIRTFSVKDAKTARLWKKSGMNGSDTPWITYPKIMLQMRARGFALRHLFPDILGGMITAEEAIDYPRELSASDDTEETYISDEISKRFTPDTNFDDKIKASLVEKIKMIMPKIPELSESLIKKASERNTTIDGFLETIPLDGLQKAFNRYSSAAIN